jgi:acylphosphatase
MSDDVIAWHLRISGRVQGVWYRGWMVEQATKLGVDGWVRNRRDGSVEAVVGGRRESVRELERRCRAGPRAAVVSRVDVSTEPTLPEAGFVQRPTT